MGQLLMMLIVPPLVGIVTYAVFRYERSSLRRGGKLRLKFNCNSMELASVQVARNKSALRFA